MRLKGAHCLAQRLTTAVQALPPHFFENKFDAVRHDLCELAQLADQVQMEALAESRTAALEVGWLWLLLLAMIQHSFTNMNDDKYHDMREFYHETHVLHQFLL